MYGELLSLNRKSKSLYGVALHLTIQDINIIELEELIKTYGLYKLKAKNIMSCCKDLAEFYNESVQN